MMGEVKEQSQTISLPIDFARDWPYTDRGLNGDLCHVNLGDSVCIMSLAHIGYKQ